MPLSVSLPSLRYFVQLDAPGWHVIGGGEPGHALEDRNRQQLYDVARDMSIPGRSRMGKWELIDAIRARR